jgi:hypothetical protein
VDETSRELLMHSIDITDKAQIAAMLDSFRLIIDRVARAHGPIRSVRVGIDPVDDGLKFSVDYGVWSPPITGTIED